MQLTLSLGSKASDIFLPWGIPLMNPLSGLSQSRTEHAGARGAVGAGQALGVARDCRLT